MLSTIKHSSKRQTTGCVQHWWEADKLHCVVHSDVKYIQLHFIMGAEAAKDLYDEVSQVIPDDRDDWQQNQIGLGTIDLELSNKTAAELKKILEAEFPELR